MFPFSMIQFIHMKSFRNYVQARVSKQSLHLLLVAGIISLIGTSVSLYKGVEIALSEMNAGMAPSLHLAYVNRDAISPRIPSTPPPFIEVPKKTLKIGDAGEDVLLLQSFLSWRGYWPDGEPLSKYFGETTQTAVKNYQTKNGLEPEGTVGPQTREVWKKDIERAI